MGGEDTRVFPRRLVMVALGGEGGEAAAAVGSDRQRTTMSADPQSGNDEQKIMSSQARFHQSAAVLSEWGRGLTLKMGAEMWKFSAPTLRLWLCLSCSRLVAVLNQH